MKQKEKKIGKRIINYPFIIIVVGLFLSIVTIVNAVPQGLTDVINIENSTKGSTAGLMVNESQGGGYIYTMNITGVSQNSRWKAYVGNVSGKLTLDDSTGSTIYDWTLTTVTTGRLFATRNDATPSWTNVNCTWTFTADYDTNNRSIEELENNALSHTSVDDNISATFAIINNSQFNVGSITIAENTCYTIHTYVNATTYADKKQTDRFEEVILYDGTLPIYATLLEQDEEGFDNNTYDFQIILPEDGSSDFASSTAYYFFLELD